MHLYYMCETCILHVFYTCITGVWITCIIHLNTTHVLHVYHTCNIHVAHLVVYGMPASWKLKCQIIQSHWKPTQTPTQQKFKVWNQLPPSAPLKSATTICCFEISYHHLLLQHMFHMEPNSIWMQESVVISNELGS